MNSHKPNIKTTEDLFADTEKAWDYSDDGFDYKFILGNEKIVFIKGGAGASAGGYKDKYIKMAERVHERLGATVICASNPEEPICEAPDEEEIRWVVAERGFSNFELYFVGVSDGSYENLKLASKFPETVKFLGVNSSYIYFENFENKLKNLPQVEKILVYGTNDEDYDEVSQLKNSNIENFKFVSVKGADHSFNGMIEEFIALVELLY
ncbi:MAG: hypothetical protein J6S23_03540 [Clostridia bacterium]|nr:hypothetical protein [Clostridia bacterium]